MGAKKSVKKAKSVPANKRAKITVAPDAIDAMPPEKLRQELRELRQSERTLRENDYFLRKSQWVAAVGSYFTDFTTGIWRSSEALDAIYGIDVGYERTIPGWLDLVHWGDREMMERHLKEDVLMHHKPFAKEYRIVRRSDGEIRWVSGLGAVDFDENGVALSMVGTIQDITERRQVEDRLRILSRVVDQSPSSIIITDRSGNIEYANPRFEKSTGYTLAEVRGMNTRMLKSGVTPSEVYAELWQVIAKGGEWRGELCNRKKNGRLFWEYASISGLKDDRGEIAHYIAVKEDITARKRAEAENVKLRGQLGQAG